MIERQDVIRCDNLRLITAGPHTGTVARCRMTFTTPDGIKTALRKATARGWIAVYDQPNRRRCHLCPDCAHFTHAGRHAVLAAPHQRTAPNTPKPSGATR